MACITMCCGLNAVCVIVVQRDCDISGIALGCKTSQPGTATGLRHNASLVGVLHTLTNDANKNAKLKWLGQTRLARDWKV